MPISNYHSTASAELCDQYCDAILQHLSKSSEPQNLCEVRDAIGAWTFETYKALKRLQALDLVEITNRPYVGIMYAATAKAGAL